MKTVITISRAFGSGGREIGKRLSDELDYAYYDRELINDISQETGLSKDYIEKYSEGGFTHSYPFHYSQSFVLPTQLPSDSLQIAQTNIVKRVAKSGNCIIVGRRSDYILRDDKPFKVFVYASDMGQRIERCYDKVPGDRVKKPKDIEKEILSIDKMRAKYYMYHTDQKWGEMKNYNLCIDTSMVDIKTAVKIIAEAVRARNT
ncbi:MAG: cytidylate kinase-like family protein [Clostridia bacterium]